MVDLRAVLGVEALVRGVAGGEAADALAGRGVELVHDVARRGGDEQPRAVLRDGHVVGAVPVDARAPDDLPGRELDRDHVGQ